MEHRPTRVSPAAPLLDANGKVVALAISAELCVPIQAARKLIP